MHHPMPHRWRSPRRAVTLALRTSVFLVASTIAATVVPGPHAQATPTPATLTIHISRTQGIYYDQLGPVIPNDTFTVSGYLKTDDGNPISGQPIDLYRRRKTDNRFFHLAQHAVTDSTGHYAFSRKVDATASYGTHWAGDGANLGEVYSDVAVDILAQRDFNAGRRRINGKPHLYGHIRPHWGGHRVVLQRQRCKTCPWRNMRAKTTGPHGGWDFAVSRPRKVGPLWNWRVTLAARNNFERSFSRRATTRRVCSRT